MTSGAAVTELVAIVDAGGRWTGYLYQKLATLYQLEIWVGYYGRVFTIYLEEEYSVHR